MPQPNRKRGRRMEGPKRKHENVEGDSELAESSIKRRKSIAEDETDIPVITDGQDEDHEEEALDDAYPPRERPFFGMLDDEEQEYFKHADDMLESNSFNDLEERSLFISNVYREADGKELKIAQSQSCSRLMERLIQMSTSAQLKALFQKFSGHFKHLVCHRFASHCCEALFLCAAPYVTEELLLNNQTYDALPADNEDVYVSMESLYLYTLGELEGDVGYLLTDRFASHVLRVLLLVLAGEPMDKASTKHLLQSKRKESNFIEGAELPNMQSADESRTVPNSFSEVLGKLIFSSIAGLNTDGVRALATHPNANPVLQLLLKLELQKLGKQRAKDEASIIRTLLPDDPISADSGSATFINGLAFDPVGSHLVEKIVEYAPDKMVKDLYHGVFKERLAQYARNEVAGYVACRVLERLNEEDLLDAHERLAPIITSLLQGDRTMVVRTLIERCTIRDIDTRAIAVQVDATWHVDDGFEIKKLLKFEDGLSDTTIHRNNVPNGPTGPTPFIRSQNPIKVHFNILAQAMLLVPGSLSALVLDSLITLDSDTLLRMAKDHIVSRTLQAAVTSRNTSMITTRKLIQHLYGHMGDLALDSAASHVVDCIWEGTHGLAFIRERIAEELAENEGLLRESAHGRAVWKNWKMDLYKRRRGDWVRQSRNKASNDGFQSFSELDINKDEGESAKTPIQLARERHARSKARKHGRKGKSTSGRSIASTKSARSGRSGRSARSARSAMSIASPAAAAT